MDPGLVAELRELQQHLANAEMKAMAREGSMVDQLQAKLEMEGIAKVAAQKDAEEQRTLLSSAIAGASQLALEVRALDHKLKDSANVMEGLRREMETERLAASEREAALTSRLSDAEARLLAKEAECDELRAVLEQLQQRVTSSLQLNMQAQQEINRSVSEAPPSDAQTDHQQAADRSQSLPKRSITIGSTASEERSPPSQAAVAIANLWSCIEALEQRQRRGTLNDESEPYNDGTPVASVPSFPDIDNDVGIHDHASRPASTVDAPPRRGITTVVRAPALETSRRVTRSFAGSDTTSISSRATATTPRARPAFDTRSCTAVAARPSSAAKGGKRVFGATRATNTIL